MVDINPSSSILASSFKDPSGFLFSKNGILFRQINNEYRSTFEKLLSSGLYDDLSKKGWLVAHKEVQETFSDKPDICYKVIRPEIVEFISYPYEWSFSQLKDAAMLTLEIQKAAIMKGLILKDASAYNIQFHHGKPILIDTLSFDKYFEGAAWDGYKQFCQHFLAPLALISRKDIRLSQLLRIYIDGIPLDLASKLLPWNTNLNIGLLTHIHVHAKTQKRYSAKRDLTREKGSVSKNGLLGLIESLQSTIRSLTWNPAGTEWADYYDITNYSPEAFEKKRNLVGKLVDLCEGKKIWDIGANTGEFSRAISGDTRSVVAFDIDPAAVEKNYQLVKKNKERTILPLVLDLTNPSGNIGWAGLERDSLEKRGPADIILSLALIHHICISNNVPLEEFAAYLQRLGKFLIIEFVPKSDSQVKILLQSRKDIFPKYNMEGFESAFNTYFDMLTKLPVEGSERILYLYKNNNY
jgi:SAM-dependent methyltransferase